MYIPSDELGEELVDSDSSRTVRVKKSSAKHDNVHTEYTKENIEVLYMYISNPQIYV